MILPFVPHTISNRFHSRFVAETCICIELPHNICILAVRSELETVKNILLFILFTKPGQYPSLPTLGYDIGSKLYSFYDDIREDDIIEDVCSQCEALRPYFNNGQIALKKDKYNDQPSMLISISGSESFPAGYRNASRNNNSRYMIGITYDDLHKMIYDVKQQRIQ